ncbi:interleukin binding protein [Turkeypox virus]|uniref:Interleukin binding protein n=1 Tax=Turkeypox virus TaxID=336486 RepID=A0A0M3ZRN2_9POXV|nr:interleukin binding protein [Turkeypox virus]ALA62422.1 interleukin binding protein [Turkeypox virus]
MLIIWFLLIVYSVSIALADNEYSTEEYYAAHPTGYLDLEDYTDGEGDSLECCPGTYSDCRYINITSRSSDDATIRLICIGCGFLNISSVLYWKGPGDTSVRNMSGVIYKDAVSIDLVTTRFIMRELVINSTRNNGSEFTCSLFDTNGIMSRKLSIKSTVYI